MRKKNYLLRSTWRAIGNWTKLLLLIFLSSCSDVFEEDISDDAVALIAPSDSAVLTSSQVQFLWDDLEGADRFQLQIAEPNFIAIERLLEDTLLFNLLYLRNLRPGEYGWRVRGLNDAYMSQWTSFTFRVDSTNDLSGQVPVLITPTNEFVDSDSTVFFSWSPLLDAEDYRFEIRLESLEGALLQAPIIIEETSHTETLGEGRYFWGVQAQNSDPTFSDFSFNSLVIDQTAPTAPVLILPGNDSLVSGLDLIEFNWQSGADELSSVSDSISIALDIDFENLVYSEIANSPLIIEDLDFNSGEFYFWRVRSRDEADNSSTSVINMFEIE